MKITFDEKDLFREFEFYKDQVAPLETEIVKINFLNEGKIVKVTELEVIFGKKKKEKQ
jgi:hypothetical protein